MKRVFAIVVLLGLLARSAPAADAPNAGPAPRRMYAVSLTITGPKDGQTQTLAEPTLFVRDGEPGSFLSGGELAVDGEEGHRIPVGLQAKFTIREADDNLKITAFAGNSELTYGADGSVNVHQSGTQSLVTLKPGGTFVLAMGEGRQARVTVMALGVAAKAAPDAAKAVAKVE